MNVSLPSVSVVIPAFNAETTIRTALESVLYQTSPPFECVVVDDGSTDQTQDIVNEFGSRVRSIKQSNRGVSAARNSGISAARGTYVAFLDADDVWLQEKLSCQLDLIRQNHELAMVYSGYHLVSHDLAQVLKTVVPSAPADVIRATFTMEGPPAGIAFTGLVSRDALSEVGGFDESLSTSADADLVCRVASRYEVAAVYTPLVLYRQHPRQMHRDVDLFERDMLHVIRKLVRDPVVGPTVKPFHRRALANLYVSLGLTTLTQRRLGASLNYLAHAFANDPFRALNVATASALRRIRTRTFSPRPNGSLP